MRLDTANIKLSKLDLNRGIIIPKKMSPELAEEIGLHAGDGSMNFYSGKGLFQLRGHIKDDREHYEKKIKELYKTLYNLDVNIREMKSTGVIGFQIWSDAIVNFKHRVFELPLGKKYNLAVPDKINSNLLFCSFLRGLFDTDGTVYIENKRGKPYPRVEIKTTSKPMFIQITEFLKRENIHATYYRYERKQKNWNDLYSIMVRGDLPVTNWIEKIGSNNPKHIRKFKNILNKNGPAEI